MSKFTVLPLCTIKYISVRASISPSQILKSVYSGSGGRIRFCDSVALADDSRIVREASGHAQMLALSTTRADIVGRVRPDA